MFSFACQPFKFTLQISTSSILFPILLSGCLPCSHWFIGAVFIHPAIKVSDIFKCFNAVESCIFKIQFYNSCFLLHESWNDFVYRFVSNCLASFSYYFSWFFCKFLQIFYMSSSNICEQCFFFSLSNPYNFTAFSCLLP